MNKRGQFFLIAAFVIVGIVVSLSTVYIAINGTKEETKVFDLSKEISEETAQIITNGEITNDLLLKEHLESLSANYSQSYPDSEIAIIYGNNEGIQLDTYYRCDPAYFTLEASTTYTCVKRKQIDSLQNEPQNSDSNLRIDSGKITAKLKGEEYQFNIPANQDNYFYIIVRTPKAGQKTIAITGSNQSAVL